jgi:hypothetical protein
MFMERDTGVQSRWHLLKEEEGSDDDPNMLLGRETTTRCCLMGTAGLEVEGERPSKRSTELACGRMPGGGPLAGLRTHTCGRTSTVSVSAGLLCGRERESNLEGTCSRVLDAIAQVMYRGERSRQKGMQA